MIDAGRKKIEHMLKGYGEKGEKGSIKEYLLDERDCKVEQVKD